MWDDEMKILVFLLNRMILESRGKKTQSRLKVRFWKLPL